MNRIINILFNKLNELNLISNNTKTRLLSEIHDNEFILKDSIEECIKIDTHINSYKELLLEKEEQ